MRICCFTLYIWVIWTRCFGKNVITLYHYFLTHNRHNYKWNKYQYITPENSNNSTSYSVIMENNAETLQHCYLWKTAILYINRRCFMLCAVSECIQNWATASICDNWTTCQLGWYNTSNNRAHWVSCFDNDSSCVS